MTKYYDLTGKRLTDEEGELFFKILGNVLENAKKLDISICGPDGLGEPIITTEKVVFNGDASLEEAGDDFVLEPESFFKPYSHFSKRDRFFCFCNTENKPYGIVVNAVLELAEALQYVTNVATDREDIEEEDRGSGLFCLSMVKGFPKYVASRPDFELSLTEEEKNLLDFAEHNINLKGEDFARFFDESGVNPEDFKTELMYRNLKLIINEVDNIDDIINLGRETLIMILDSQIDIVYDLEEYGTRKFINNYFSGIHENIEYLLNYVSIDGEKYIYDNDNEVIELSDGVCIIVF